MRFVAKIARSLAVTATVLTVARVLTVFISDRDHAEAALTEAGARPS